MNPLEKFTIANISKKLNQINLKISQSHNSLFPPLHLLSHYQFKKQFVKIFPNGDIQGGLVKMIVSLIDFSFIRSLVAHCYSPFGPPPYDPVSLFLLDLFRYMDGFNYMSDFLSLLRDKDRGRAYRAYAGISHEFIPCEATFSNFRLRLGEKLYNEIFHILVDIFHRLHMISFKILAHDGTLYPTWARYKGCTYFCDDCHSIVVSDVITKVRNRILYRLDNLSGNNLGSEIRVYTDCPSSRFPQDIEKPKIELFAFKLSFADSQLSQEQINTAILFNVKDLLEKQNLALQTIRSNVSSFNLDNGSFNISCPKLPKDTDARIGVRRDPQNSDKKQKIFGYNGVFSTSIELQLGLELPVAASNISGNADEGSYIITNKEQISNHHQCTVKIDLADSKYDITANYDYIRGTGSIPIIDYNPRNEDLSKQALHERGFDQNGWPFAPCGLLCRPNGFDENRQRLSFCCFKQCLTLNRKALEDLQNHYDLASCPFIQNQTGFVHHMSIQDHPRLINQIPRGSKLFATFKKFRSASERSNSSIKDNFQILSRPRVIGSPRSAVLTQTAAIVLLLNRAFSFIVKITILFRKLPLNPSIMERLKPPSIPKSIASVIQRE